MPVTVPTGARLVDYPSGNAACSAIMQRFEPLM
jgi:hypothetical protein